MTTKNTLNKRYILGMLLSAGVLISIVGIGYIIYVALGDGTHPINSSSPMISTQASYVILKPAMVRPKTAECSQTLSYASDGNPSPYECSSGYINVLAWESLAALEPSVMKLNYSSTQAQVEAAMCSDATAGNQDSTTAISAPLETTAYELSALYYGWNFKFNPATLLGGGC